MSTHLLLVSIGPVQEFIAQARRTRDLWFGSHVLSEVSKAAARAIAEHPGSTLVFPALDRGVPELEPSDQPRDEDGEAVYSVANKILALVAGDPGSIAADARDAARDRLVKWGTKVLHEKSELVEPGMEASAGEQLETFLDIRALWAPCDRDVPGEYKTRREHLEAELGARKTLHDFAPWCKQRGGVQKSSLDGGRESVLRQDGRDGGMWRRYYIGAREQLDAVGLLKRTGGKPEQFVPIPTVGLLPWLEARAAPAAPGLLAALRKQCKKLRLTRVHRRERYRIFPYDAQIFLPERWKPYLDEQAGRPDGPDERLDPAAFGANHVAPILACVGEPYPYVACIVADGDHMGKTLDTLAEAGLDAHRAFSQQLAHFASEARDIVEQEHRGVLVYAGGDDVLGFVAVQEAVFCAARLRQAFETVVSKPLEDVGREALAGQDLPVPTLSVGLGIGHILQSLGTLLELGRKAEKAAKHAGRNRLAIVLEKHSGTRRTWTWPWTNDSDRRISAEHIIQDAVDVLARGELSHKKVHELDALLRRTPATDMADALGPDRAHDQAHDQARDGAPELDRWARFLGHEVRRILARAGAGQAPATDAVHPETVKLDLNGPLSRVRHNLESWVARMLIARELALAARAITPIPAENQALHTEELAP